MELGLKGKVALYMALCPGSINIPNTGRSIIENEDDLNILFDRGVVF